MALPTRAVRLIPIGEQPDAATLGAEEVAAYRTVATATVLVRQLKAAPVTRNAMREASARVYAAANFR